jgi:hypothetical protein
LADEASWVDFVGDIDEACTADVLPAIRLGWVLGRVREFAVEHARVVRLTVEAWIDEGAHSAEMSELREREHDVVVRVCTFLEQLNDFFKKGAALLSGRAPATIDMTPVDVVEAIWATHRGLMAPRRDTPFDYGLFAGDDEDSEGERAD